MAGVYLGPYVPPHAHARQFTELLASPGTPIDPTANYTAAIVLKLKAGGEDALKNAVARTSDPQHADYGKFLTRTEVVALTAPPSDYVEAVQHWLEHGDCQGHGPQSSKIRATLSKGGDVIWVSGQIKDVESRFGTRLALFDHGERKAVRASMPLSAVPYCASQHMSFVTMNTPIQPGRARREDGRRTRRAALVGSSPQPGDPRRPPVRGTPQPHHRRCAYTLYVPCTYSRPPQPPRTVDT